MKNKQDYINAWCEVENFLNQLDERGLNQEGMELNELTTEQIVGYYLVYYPKNPLEAWQQQLATSTIPTEITTNVTKTNVTKTLERFGLGSGRKRTRARND